MFKKILLPLPSEYFPEIGVKRAIDLAGRFKSELVLEYIYDEQVIDKINNVSSGAVTQCSLEEMAEEVKNVEVSGESFNIFAKIEKLARRKNIELLKKIHIGIHTDEILDCIREENIDLIISEFHKDTLIKYRIFYDSPVPIWLENNGKKIKEIYGILTNLSPNILAPGFAFKFSKESNIPLHFYYVLDEEEKYDKKRELISRKKLFSIIKGKCKATDVECEIDLVIQDISTFITHEFKHKDHALIILGRFKKPVRLPFINLDKKIEVSKKLQANVLMLK